MKNKKVAYNLLVTCFTFVLLTLFGCLQKHKDNLSRLFKRMYCDGVWLTKPIKRIMKYCNNQITTGTSIWLRGKKFNFWSMKDPVYQIHQNWNSKIIWEFGSLVSEKSKLKILGIAFLVNLKWWRIANTDYI